MLAARLYEGRVVVQTVPIPEPRVGEARLRILQGGICSTDIEMTRGYKGGGGGHTLGHEFVARVDKLNVDLTSQRRFCHVSEGQRVVAEINCVSDSCGCRNWQERAQHPERVALGIFGADGAFAEYLVVPIINLHPVPASISDDQAMFVEPLAAACQITQQVQFLSGDRVAVVGTGKLGILIVQAILATSACRITAFGRRETNFHLFMDRGVETRLVSSIDAAEKYDVVVDCTGNETGFETALNLVKPHGKLVLKSTFAGKSPANLTKVVVDEISIIGSRCGPFSMALKLLEDRRVSVEELITHRYPLPQVLTTALHCSFTCMNAYKYLRGLKHTQIGEALEMAMSHESLKVALMIYNTKVGTSANAN